MFRFFCPAFLLVVASVSVCQAEDATATATAPAASEQAEVKFTPNVVYGTGGGVDLHLDIAQPASSTGKSPCVVFIHGGGWAMGDKSMHASHIKQFAKNGFVAASVQYRFSPRYRFPAQVEDVKCAVRYLRAHADQYGLDPDRIGAVGFSAGAHLAMMLGAMDPEDGLEGDGGWQDQPSKVQAVVSYFGPTDFRTGPVPTNAGRLLENFIGGSRDEMKDAWHAASPAKYVNKGDAPMLLFQGTRDPLVPYTQAMQMGETMAEAGIPGRVELIMNAGHGFSSKESARAYLAAKAFFEQHL